MALFQFLAAVRAVLGKCAAGQKFAAAVGAPDRQQLVQAAKTCFFGLNEEEVQILFQPKDRFSGAKGAAYHVIKKMLLEA